MKAEMARETIRSRSQIPRIGRRRATGTVGGGVEVGAGCSATSDFGSESSPSDMCVSYCIQIAKPKKPIGCEKSSCVMAAMGRKRLSERRVTPMETISSTQRGFVKEANLEKDCWRNMKAVAQAPYLLFRDIPLPVQDI